MRDVHQNQRVLTTGAPLDQAKAAMVMIHGRGASAETILSHVPKIDQDGFVYLPPQAANGTWYPYSFLNPIDTNEPYLSSALSVVVGVVNSIEQAGIPPEKIMLLGFSQGACLTLE